MRSNVDRLSQIIVSRALAEPVLILGTPGTEGVIFVARQLEKLGLSCQVCDSAQELGRWEGMPCFERVILAEPDWDYYYLAFEVKPTLLSVLVGGATWKPPWEGVTFTIRGDTKDGPVFLRAMLAWIDKWDLLT